MTRPLPHSQQNGNEAPAWTFTRRHAAFLQSRLSSSPCHERGPDLPDVSRLATSTFLPEEDYSRCEGPDKAGTQHDPYCLGKAMSMRRLSWVPRIEIGAEEQDDGTREESERKLAPYGRARSPTTCHLPLPFLVQQRQRPRRVPARVWVAFVSPRGTQLCRRCHVLPGWFAKISTCRSRRHGV
jgi:hypothetical protein